MEKLLPVFFSTAFFNIPRSGALEREKFVESKQKKKKTGEAMGRRNNLDGVCGRCIAFFHRVSPIKGSSM